jgi:hypothetical protein
MGEVEDLHKEVIDQAIELAEPVQELIDVFYAEPDADSSKLEAAIGRHRWKVFEANLKNQRKRGGILTGRDKDLYDQLSNDLHESKVLTRKIRWYHKLLSRLNLAIKVLKGGPHNA